ncbi:MAG: hypothetical protein QM639_07375 [Rhodocyclaceae bacterium]
MNTDDWHLDVIPNDIRKHMKEVFSKPLALRDWKGIVTAENGQSQDLHAWMKMRRLINAEEIPLGLELATKEDADAKDGFNRTLRAYVVSYAGYENVQALIDNTHGPLQVKIVDLSLTESEFFSFFSRFSLRMSFHGMLNGVEYETTTDVTPAMRGGWR